MLKKTVLIIAAAAVFGSGCAKKAKVKPVAVTPQVTTDEPSIRYPDWQAIPDLKPAYFDYDRAILREDTRSALKANASFLKDNPDLDVLVEGHCDERGTTAYNLGLGQRRAAAVREYYGKLGVPVGRIGTISYGEEVPSDLGHTPMAWEKNRRAETKVRSRAAAKPDAPAEQ